MGRIWEENGVFFYPIVSQYFSSCFVIILIFPSNSSCFMICGMSLYGTGMGVSSEINSGSEYSGTFECFFIIL